MAAKHKKILRLSFSALSMVIAASFYPASSQGDIFVRPGGKQPSSDMVRPFNPSTTDNSQKRSQLYLRPGQKETTRAGPYSFSGAQQKSRSETVKTFMGEFDAGMLRTGGPKPQNAKDLLMIGFAQRLPNMNEAIAVRNKNLEGFSSLQTRLKGVAQKSARQNAEAQKKYIKPMESAKDSNQK